jgi:DNA-directed RNA polymerase specialized sigma24 family protein
LVQARRTQRPRGEASHIVGEVNACHWRCNEHCRDPTVIAWGVLYGCRAAMGGPVMENDPSPSGPGLPPWERLLRAFLLVLDTEDAHQKADAVCKLFLDDPWFQDLVERRARQAVSSHAVPFSIRDDLQQEISLLFVQKARHSPDLHVNLEMVEAHFGGWMWTIVDRLCAEATQRLHRAYRSQSGLAEDLAVAAKRQLDVKIDVSIALAELPLFTRTVLSLFEQGHTVKEIAALLGEKYWKVYDTYRRGIEFLREKLGE